jgi:hypothetical protein
MSAYFEVKGTDIKWEYNGKLYSITGNDVGVVAGSPGSIWVEGNYLAYIDELNHKRLYYIDPTGVFPTAAIPGAIFVNQNDSMLRIVNSSKEVRITNHSDHSDTSAINKTKYNDSDAHSDTIIVDIPHADETYYSDTIPIHDDYSPPYSNHSDYSDTPYSDTHSDTPYKDLPTYTDHSNYTDQHYDDVYTDYSQHNDVVHHFDETYTDHSNYTDQHYDDTYTDHHNTPHSDTHSDAAHSDSGGYTDYTDGIYANWTDSLPGPDPHADRIYSDHSDWVNESHSDWSDYYKSVQHLDTPRIQQL